MTKMKPSSGQPVPAFIGIGAMRCGTTWIADQLREHPNIHIPADFIEIHYFDNYYDQGMDWYRANFSEATPDQICGEFTPSYMRTKGVRQRIERDFPEVKLIISIRDPVARAYSHHNFLRIRTDIAESFHEAIQDNRFDILKAGLYGEQLNNWFRSFAPEQIHVILFEDILNHPEQVTTDLYRFLQVDHHFLPIGLVQKANVSHGVRSQHLASFMRKIRHLIKPHIAGRKGLRRLGVFKIGQRINQLNWKPPTVPPLDENARFSLQAYYRKDIELLESILEKDLSHWK